MNDEATGYWPSGFEADLTQYLKSGLLAEKAESEELVAIFRRAAVDMTRPRVERPDRFTMESRGKRAEFEAHLQARWGSGLDLMELAVDDVLESGFWVSRLDPAKPDNQNHKFTALIRLQGRAAMTAQEVLTLLRSGFASGAMARWRTLHEIWVVFIVLQDGDEELARRYLAHDAVESMKGQEDYEDTWATLGYDPPDMTAEQRTALRSSLAAEFGDAFLRDYGWAAPLFGGAAPKFKQIQQSAQLEHWKSHYRMASHSTHANPKGVTWNIGAGDNESVVMAGPSNAGLLDPAQCTLIAAANVTIGLLLYALDELLEDEMVIVDVLLRQQRALVLMDAAIEELSVIHGQLESEIQSGSELAERTAAALAKEPMLTADELAGRLGVGTEQVEEALISGAMLGQVIPETRYRLPG